MLGVHGRYNITDAAFLRGQFSGMVSSNSNNFRTVTGATASTSTTSGGLYGAVYGGYDLAGWTSTTPITQELETSALWSHIPSMDGHYNDPALNQSYASQNYTVVYGNASLRWAGDIDLGGVMVKPTIMGGMRQTLTDGKIKSALTFAGNRFESSITDDRTIGIAQVGAAMPVAANADLGLNYYGEYGDSTTNHMGYLNLKVKF